MKINKEIESLEAEIIKDISNKITQQIKYLIIEALKLHGFEFENEKELYSFIKTYCKREYYDEIGKTIFLVKNVPFLFHYNNINDFIGEKFFNDKFEINYGTYYFLPKK